MANVAHKNLTGTDLHEPKGVAAATANKVYVSNGAASGTWQKVTRNELDAANGGNPFGASLLHVRDEKTSGTTAGTFNSGAWRTRTLNTVKTNEISGSSLSSNQITLPAGTYWIEAVAAFHNCGTGYVQARLQNITDATTTIIGLNQSGQTNTATGADIGCGQSPVRGRFTTAGAKVFELQHRCNTSGVFGTPTSLNTEVYAEVCIWKL